MYTAARVRRGVLRSAWLAPLFLLAACGGGSGDPSFYPVGENQAPADDPVVAAGLQPVVDETEWSDVLVDCVSATQASDSCTLSTLPLIGQTVASPALTHVMQRTAVSHPWMGQRLQQVLPLLPADILRLMSSVTAVVVSSDVRPAFYSSLTGAIYLDPYYLWLDNDEKATISRDEDFRSGFADELPFVSLSRYVLAGNLAWRFYDLAGDDIRSLNDLVQPLAALLYHELAHANDFFPRSQYSFLDGDQSVLAAAEALEDQRLAIALNAAIPLTSELLRDLAQVMYQGADASEDEMELDAGFVGSTFETDGASDDYGYNTIYEDVAMLFEEVMMHHHFGIDRDIAYSQRPQDPEADCSAYLVAWGVRNRVADPLVRARAEFVLEALTDAADVAVFFEGLDSVVPLDTGVSWCDTISAAPLMSERGGFLPLSRQSFSRYRLK